MIRCRDTFLHFLADNLKDSGGTSVPVHPIRFDANDPKAGFLQDGAVNVQFLSVSLNAISTLQVVIDVVHSDENTVVSWITSIFSLLRSAYYTPLLDYTDVENPVTTGSNIMWDQAKVKFSRIYNDNYCHYSCVLPIQFYS